MAGKTRICVWVALAVAVMMAPIWASSHGKGLVEKGKRGKEDCPTVVTRVQTWQSNPLPHHKGLQESYVTRQVFAYSGEFDPTLAGGEAYICRSEAAYTDPDGHTIKIESIEEYPPCSDVDGYMRGQLTDENTLKLCTGCVDDEEGAASSRDGSSTGEDSSCGESDIELEEGTSPDGGEGQVSPAAEEETATA